MKRIEMGLRHVGNSGDVAMVLRAGVLGGPMMAPVANGDRRCRHRRDQLLVNISWCVRWLDDAKSQWLGRTTFAQRFKEAE